MELNQYPLPRIVGFVEPPHPSGMREMVVNAGATEKIEVTGQSSLTKDQVRQITDGSKIRLYVWGTIYYLDVFGVEHHTEVCEVLGGRKMKSGTTCPHTGAN
jgi:hypothetical protein